jgi:hypothetical protein
MSIGLDSRPLSDLSWSMTALPLPGCLIKLLIHPRLTVHGPLTYEATLAEICCTPDGETSGARTRWEGKGFASREAATKTAMDIWINWQGL